MQSTSNLERLTVTLDTVSAEALAHLFKRLDYAGCRVHSVSDEEAYRMQFAAQTVLAALAESGIAVR